MISTGTMTKTIGILGGGTAGYLAALGLKKHVPGVQVEVIAAPDIPPIGVGESTTPQIVWFLHHYLGLDAGDFYQKVRPTWKLGVQLEWGLPGDYWFNFPFDIIEAADEAPGFDIRRASLLAVLMDLERSPVLRPEGDAGHTAVKRNSYAYHLDNRLLIAYLREEVVKAGIPIIDARITRMDVDERKEHVTALHAGDGRSFTYDLIVDCSGFRSLLLEGALGVPFINYRPSLFTNRAVLGNLPHHHRIRPYTGAYTMKNGWVWRIPTEEEDHLGYVFSGEHCSDDEAAAEMTAVFGVQVEPHVIRFRSGRHDVSWKGNVVAIGNSYAFVEPLEATGVMMIVREVRNLVDALNGPKERAVARDEFNHVMNVKWDFLRGFLAIHYRFNKRMDTPFWRDCRAHADLAGMEGLVHHFHEKGLLTLADRDSEIHFDPLWEAGVFGTNGIDVMLLGQGERPPAASIPRDPARTAWSRRKRALWAQLAARALPVNAALPLVKDQPGLLLSPAMTTSPLT